MHRILHSLILTLLLAGCQNIPLEELDFDRQKDFSRWHSWQWSDPDISFATSAMESDLDRERIRQAISEQLQQRGLKPSAQPDFKVRAWLSLENRVEEHRSHAGFYGGYWGNPWGYYYAAPVWTENQNLNHRVFILQLDFLDAQTGKLAWRASEKWSASGSITRPQKRAAEIHKTVMRLLEHFPPAGQAGK